MILAWVLLAAAAIAVELVGTTALFALFVGIGFAAAAIAAATGVAAGFQALAAAVVAALGVLLVRPLLVRHLDLPASVPGVSDLVGQRAITVDEVGDEHHPGHALLLGERWLAVAEDAVVPPQTAVQITGVRGTTLLVRPVAGH